MERSLVWNKSNQLLKDHNSWHELHLMIDYLGLLKMVSFRILDNTVLRIEEIWNQKLTNMMIIKGCKDRKAIRWWDLNLQTCLTVNQIVVLQLHWAKPGSKSIQLTVVSVEHKEELCFTISTKSLANKIVWWSSFKTNLQHLKTSCNKAKTCNSKCAMTKWASLASLKTRFATILSNHCLLNKRLLLKSRTWKTKFSLVKKQDLSCAINFVSLKTTTARWSILSKTFKVKETKS